MYEKSWLQKPLATLPTQNRDLIDHLPADDVEISVLYGLKLTKEEVQKRYSLSKHIVPFTRTAGGDALDSNSLDRLKSFGAFLHVDVARRSRMSYSSMEARGTVSCQVR